MQFAFPEKTKHFHKNKEDCFAKHTHSASSEDDQSKELHCMSCVIWSSISDPRCELWWLIISSLAV